MKELKQLYYRRIKAKKEEYMKNPYATTAALLCTLCLLAATACRQAGGTQESGNTVQDLSALTGQGEVLLSGGNILTMTDNPDGSPVTAEALLIRDGKIAAVGTLAETGAQASSSARRIDLEGKTLLPGFIDGHSHITSYAQTLAIAQLGDVTTDDEIVAVMQAFLKDNADKMQEGDWLVGFGYDNNNLPGRRHPTKEVLDRISAEIPVSITHASGHMGVLNSKALEVCGITAATPDPQGGRIGREPGSSEPDGYVEEKAFMECAGKTQMPQVSMNDLIARAQNAYFRYGITTTQDARIFEKEFAILQEAAESGVLQIDVVGYADMKDASQLLAEHADMHNVYRSHFKLGGYKIFLDGSPQGRTAWLSEPYLPQNGSAPDYCGYPVYKDEEVQAFAARSLAEGISLHAHCNGDAAAAQYIRAFRQALAEQNGGKPARAETRPVMIHTQVIRPEQFREMAETGILPSMFPAHIWHWGDVHIENLGMERASHISAVNSARKAGLPYTFHQDTPVIPPDMLETIWCAAARITKNGVQFAEDEKVSVYDALKAVTVHGAWEIWEEDSKGTLEPGKRADLTVLDGNPLTVSGEELRSLRVLHTIKDGKTVYTAG